MRLTLILALLALNGFYCIGLSQSLPKVTVSGNHFITPENDQIIFHGLNSSDPDKLEKEGQWNENYFRALKSWNANIVRFPIHPVAWRSRGKEAYIALLDDGIKWAEKQGLYVILDWHSIGNLQSELFQNPSYNTTKRETYEFWRTMARRYGKNSTVAFFELFNEPTVYNGQLGVATWKEWKSIMEELIIIIRANGAENIPLVAGFNWAYDLTEVENEPIDAEGIAYVSHPYPQKREQPWEEQWEKDWGFVANKYPIILTEVGFCIAEAKGAHVPVISNPDYVEKLTNYTDKNGISFVVWVFDPNWSPMLIENWDFEPTDAGKVWKEKMKTY